MRLNIILHRNAELDDWEEKIREALEGKVEPLELNFTVVPTEFDVLDGIDESSDVNVVVFAPKKGTGAVVAPVVEKLLEKGTKIFFAWYEDMLSMLEDFVVYLYGLLGIKG